MKIVYFSEIQKIMIIYSIIHSSQSGNRTKHRQGKTEEKKNDYWLTDWLFCHQKTFIHSSVIHSPFLADENTQNKESILWLKRRNLDNRILLNTFHIEWTWWYLVNNQKKERKPSKKMNDYSPQWVLPRVYHCKEFLRVWASNKTVSSF